ncbi:putative GMC oxidoreductase [Triangularia setosa]|uniref:GMC oxidoreductase n=1 Tax=Triangularia setosa TaxID=2587417 RepID=A0AAN6W1V4_9PEZI|nr:putative GMC oxidoreductase [Podospora setosa]
MAWSTTNNTVIFPAGGVLEGGLSINLMMYTRAQRSDFGAWNVPGWSADDTLSYLKKIFADRAQSWKLIHGVGKNEMHGHDGPIEVSTSSFTSTRLQGQFISAVKKVGWPASDDLQNLDSSNSITQRALRYITPTGTRRDTATCYLHPRLQSGIYPNLHIVYESSVILVLFDDNKRATAPSALPLFSNDPASPNILSCANIKVVVPLLEVNTSYEDNQLCIHRYRFSLLPSETVDSVTLSRVDPVSLIQNSDPMLVVRPPPEGHHFSRPCLSVRWERDFVNIPDITSLLNFKTGFLSDENGVDVKMHVWLYKTSVRLSGGWGSTTVRLRLVTPHSLRTPRPGQWSWRELKGGIEDTVYTEEDDKVIGQWVSENVGTVWHSLGTCKIDGLEIADLSVLLGNVAANTNNMTMAVGEKAAEFLSRDSVLGTE